MSDAAAPAQFPHLGEYENLLVGGGVLPPVRTQRTLGVRAPRVGGGGRGAGAGSAGRARQLQFGGPSSAAGVNRGGSSSAGAGGRRRRAPAPSAAVGGGGRRQRGRGRGLPLVPPVAPQAPSGEYDNLDDEDDEENDYEDNQGSSDAHPVSNFRANWSDQNNGRLLGLCIEQLRAGNYVDNQMNGQGYKAIAQGYYQQTGLRHTKKQFRNQIGQLKSIYSFWNFLQKHTSLGRKKDGTIDAESDFWKTQTKGKPYLNRLKNGQPPPNLAELEEMFSGNTVDGTTGFIAGQDCYEEDDDPEEDDEQDDNTFATPTSSGSLKRSIGSTTSSCTSPVKKSKSPMVRYMKQIANTFSESVQVNQQVMQSFVDEKRDARKDGGDEDISEEHGDSTSSSDGEVFEVARENIRWTNDFIARIAPLFGMYFDKFFFKQPRRVEGESGFEWVQRTLGRSTSCYNMFRVEPPLFHRLHNTLVESYGLQSTAKMTSIEALAMFLWVIGAPQSVRQAEDRFRRSLETVSRNFDIVLRSVLKLAADIIKPKDPEFSTVHPVLENANFWPHFNDCIGALDGTHVKVVVPKKLLVQHMNRHNETSQNVLAVCDFDMRFTFVLAGWPGSVHDMRVFTDAITKYVDKFPHPPPGKFYAVDAGYPNRPGYLSPYRCTRYHVDQWQNGPGPQGMKETFNHAHSQVRNVIERSFGVLKMKWRILLNMPKFSTRKQTRLIVACMALHNFIRESRIADREFAMCDEDANYFPMPPASSQDTWPQDEPLIEDANMNAFRDQLATALYHG